MSVLLGAGDGSVQAFTNFAMDSSRWGMAAADLIGDGFADIVTGNDLTDGTVSLLLRRGDGSLQARAAGFGQPPSDRLGFPPGSGTMPTIRFAIPPWSGRLSTERFAIRLGSGKVPTGGVVLAVGSGRANGEVGGLDSS
ncbi:MAG: hypothetical protein IAG10_31435 [Planctomycetaceae bacterium]|nr:hypothetical protein [Planctomycetaceae bacterium]